ncbi:DUF3800 domain-containing protein [Herbiconiux liukaitaii]|uniref:DUF3800 domain-containing protein n=1 Tax=Herbiconiux liukaitaii TaxID=3342799 RepID=UPI0035B79E8E
MWVAYLDESARNDDFYFMGSVIVDSSSIQRIETSLDHIGRMIAADVTGFDPLAEFHGYDMFHGRGEWEIVPTGWRVKACKLVAKALAASGAKYVLRGIDVNRLEARYGARTHAPHALCTAQTFESIDEIVRKDAPEGTVALVVADEHHSAPDSRRNLRQFKSTSARGYTTKPVDRIADTIYFGPSHSSRLLQISDVATYFVNRHETVIESDARVAAAVESIFTTVMTACRFYYIWKP